MAARAARKPAAKPAASPEPDVSSEALDAPVVQVQKVARQPDGTPTEPSFRLLVQEGASDADKAAGWNLDGEMPPEDLIDYIAKPHV
jgi:hypothetical protein